jgi:hypothetical protein
MTTQVISAIGGVVDRATIAFLWLGRSVFALAVFAAVCLIGAAASAWWTIPATIPEGTEVFARKVPAGMFDDLIPGAKPGDVSFAVDMPDKSTIRVIAADGAGAAAAAAKIWLERTASSERGHIYENNVLPALGFLAFGGVFLGLMRALRWILTGK